MLIDTRKIRFKVIANTLLDFPIPGDKEGTGVWISNELISLASSIIKDDLTSSPLASLFSKSKSIEVLQSKLSASEQFLASWLSDLRTDQKTAFEKTIQIFDTLTNYSSLPMKVFPLSYQQKKPISIKYRNRSGSPRSYQMYGYLDFKKKTIIDPADITASLKEEKDIDFIDSWDEKESVVPAEIEKILKEADSVIITADDFFSLAIMLSYTDVRKSIKKNSGSVLTIAPIGSRFVLDEREKVLLKIFKIDPTINGFLELMKDVSDTLAIDTGDSAIVGTARELGFNVIVEDLIKVDNKLNYLAVILKGAGIDVSDLTANNKITTSEIPAEPAKTETINKQTVQVKVSKQEEIPADTQLAKESTETPKTTTEPSDQTKEKGDSGTVSSKLDKSATIAKSAVKTTSDAESNIKETVSTETVTPEKKEIQPPQVVKTIATPNTATEKPTDEVEKIIEEENNSREKFTKLMTQISEDQFENLENWIAEVEKYIKKDEGNSIQVANGLLTIIKQTTKEKVRNNAINSFLILSDSSKLPFRNVLLVWLVSHLQDPDSSIQNSQYDVIRKMILNEKYVDFIGELLKAFIFQLLTSKDMNPSKQERGRLLVQRIAYNSRKLTKYAIEAFLDLFEEDSVSHNDIWPGLSSFDARLVGIELVEGFSVAKSKTISEEAKRKELGSFSALLEDIVSSWEKGDMNRLTSLCGTISESALRKANRLSLAQNIKKVGTVPLEIIARSLNFSQDSKELETLVYEMLMNDELHAKLEIVDGRLYIIPIEEVEDEKNKTEKIIHTELKEQIPNSKSNTSSKVAPEVETDEQKLVKEAAEEEVENEEEEEEEGTDVSEDTTKPKRKGGSKKDSAVKEV